MDIKFYLYTIIITFHGDLNVSYLCNYLTYTSHLWKVEVEVEYIIGSMNICIYVFSGTLRSYSIWL